MALNFSNFFNNLFSTAAIEEENVTHRGTVKIDLGDVFALDQFEIKGDLFTWIDVKPFDSEIHIGDSVGGDWTVTVFDGELNFTNVKAYTNFPTLGTQYLSIAGYSFHAQQPDTQDVLYSNGNITASADTIVVNAPVNLPHGAVVTNVIVYGDAAGETWTMKRSLHDSTGTQTMATGNIDSADTTISNATIDNTAYKYFIDTSSIDTGDSIRAAKITYTI